MFNYLQFSQILKENNIKNLLDIGANKAEWASKLRFFMPELNVTCIEANEECELDLKQSGYEYYIAVLSNEIKNVKFYKNQKNKACTGCSYYLENSHYYDSSFYEEKKTTTLENLLPNRIFDAIKIDTQGSEIDILKGAGSILETSKILCLEVSYKEYNKNSPKLDDVISFFKEYGGWQLIAKVGESRVGDVLYQEDFVFLKK